MATQTPIGFTVTPREEAILYFIGLFFVYLSSYAPPIAAPNVVRLFFTILGTAVIVIKYELSQNPPTTIPPVHQALFVAIALTLSVIGGQVSATFGSVWYGGLAVAIIGALLAAYSTIGGITPTVPHATG